MSRKVLVIAYFFPPLGGAGVQRVLKFVKYLPERGFDPVVLTTRSSDYPARDMSLLADVPQGTPITRVPDPSLMRRARVGFDHLGFLRLRALAGWPDEAAAWIPAALVAARRIVKRHRPDVVFSSSPPFSAHLVAWLTARAAGLPWVADFRDEFTANPRAEWRTDLVQRLNLGVERHVVSSAARVVTAADYFVMPGATPSRRLTITNGVDPEDVGGLHATQPSPRFRVSYVGTLYGDLDLAPVTSALRNLVAGGTIEPSQCELRIVGNMWLRDPPHPGDIPLVATGYVSHEQALAEMRDATVLLFYVPSSSPAPSGKIFEYLASERPILCVARRDNLAYELVTRWRVGRAVEPGDTTGIEDAIAELYGRWEAGTLAAPEQARDRVFEHYSRRKLAGVLADTFDAVVAGSRPDASRK
jgi:glycosyltransferase involved in cell wall biosynthesis